MAMCVLNKMKGMNFIMEDKKENRLEIKVSLSGADEVINQLKEIKELLIDIKNIKIEVS